MQPRTEKWKQICARLGLGCNVGKKLVSLQLTDADLIWVRFLTEDRMLSMLGFAAAQVHLMRALIDTLVPDIAASHPLAAVPVLSRTPHPVAGMQPYPVPSALAVVAPAALPAAAPPAAPPALQAPQVRGFGGKFVKKRK